MELHVGIAVTIRDAHYQVNDYGNAGSISLEMLIGGFRIILFCFDKLIVEIKVVLTTLCQLPCCLQCLQQQSV